MKSLKFWDDHPNWASAEMAWDRRSSEARKSHPLKVLKTLPDMPGITQETAKNLKWKSFKYMVQHDKDGAIRKHVLKHPLRYAFRYIRSLLKKSSHGRDGDFFLYGVSDVDAFAKMIEDPDSIFIVGFSYCHKPFECPSGRFTSDCDHDLDNPVCQQCFIGKCMHAMPSKNVVPLAIPTVHYIGEKVLDISHANPDKKVYYLITACEMTLEMFGDWGNMMGAKGIGVRLDGRICNTMRAFELSEAGVKPGLTVVLDGTQQRMLDVLQHRREVQA